MFSVYPLPLWWLREYIYTLSYYHHQSGCMNYYPSFRIRSWHNGLCFMSFYILTACFRKVMCIDGIIWRDNFNGVAHIWPSISECKKAKNMDNYYHFTDCRWHSTKMINKQQSQLLRPPMCMMVTYYLDSLVQSCSISIVDIMEILRRALMHRISPVNVTSLALELSHRCSSANDVNP